MSNQKLYYYLNSEDEHQQSLLAYLAEQKNRSQCVREALALLKGMGQVDPSLPHLLLAVLNNNGTRDEILRVLKMSLAGISPEVNDNQLGPRNQDMQIIGYQCKKPDPYQMESSEHWFPITEEIYDQEMRDPSENTRVRAIYATIAGDNSHREETLEHSEKATMKGVGVKNAAKLFK